MKARTPPPDGLECPILPLYILFQLLRDSPYGDAQISLDATAVFEQTLLIALLERFLQFISEMLYVSWCLCPLAHTSEEG